jgi:hypothetical protein
MNWPSIFQKSQTRSRQAGPHMTWATSSVGRSITRTGVFLKKQLWIWPIIAVVILSTLGLFVRWKIESVMRASLESELQTTRNLEAEMLKTWFGVQEANAESLANNLEVRSLVYPLLETGRHVAPLTGDESENEQMKLERALAPAMSAHGYDGYLVANKKRQIVAAMRREMVGRDFPEYEQFLDRALAGEVCLSPPFPSVVALKDDKGRTRTGVPTMVVAAPIRDESFQVVGVLGLRISPELEFSRIVGLGQFGESGETYAFDKNGLLVSDSRFDNQLILLGLLPDLIQHLVIFFPEFEPLPAKVPLPPWLRLSNFWVCPSEN